MGLHLFGVLRGSGLSVMGGHLGTVVRCAYLVSGFMRVKMVDACGNVAIEKRGPLEAIVADWDGDGIFEEIRAVEEVGRVRRDAVVVCGSLPIRDNVGGDSGGIRGNRGCRGGRRLDQNRGCG